MLNRGALRLVVIGSVVNLDLLLRIIQLPSLLLVGCVEVDHVQRMLQVDEEVARIVLHVVLGFGELDLGVLVLVSLVNLSLQLLLRVLVGQVHYAEVRSQVVTRFHSVNVHRLACLTNALVLSSAAVMADRGVSMSATATTTTHRHLGHLSLPE